MYMNKDNIGMTNQRIGQRSLEERKELQSDSFYPLLLSTQPLNCQFQLPFYSGLEGCRLLGHRHRPLLSSRRS